jgi:hypothetical protein
MQGDNLRLSDALSNLRDLAASGPLTLGRFLDALNARGHAFVCLVLGFPFLTPIPLPGVSIPFGVMIVVVAVCMAAGLPPWTPASWRDKKLPAELVVKALEFALKVLRKIEFLIKPRGQIFMKFPGVTRISGLAMAFCGGILAMPLPPGTNFPPALGVVLIAMGVLECDSVILGIGYLVAAINATVIGSIGLFGFEYVARLWHS